MSAAPKMTTITTMRTRLASETVKIDQCRYRPGPFRFTAVETSESANINDGPPLLGWCQHVPPAFESTGPLVLVPNCDWPRLVLPPPTFGVLGLGLAVPRFRPPERPARATPRLSRGGSQAWTAVQRSLAELSSSKQRSRWAGVTRSSIRAVRCSWRLRRGRIQPSVTWMSVRNAPGWVGSRRSDERDCLHHHVTWMGCPRKRRRRPTSAARSVVHGASAARVKPARAHRARS